MTIITNNYGQYFENEQQRTNVKGQRGWLLLSPLARQIVVTSGHDVPETEPELSTREILRVVTEARLRLVHRDARKRCRAGHCRRACAQAPSGYPYSYAGCLRSGTRSESSRVTYTGDERGT